MSGLVRPFGSYFKAGGHDPTMESIPAFLESVKSTGLKFAYGTASYSQFKNVYRSSEFWAYKMVALPSAFTSGVIKVVCHLAHIIFKGIPKTCRQFDLTYIKADIYTIIRDVEESFGWIVTFFHETWGQYLVEKSLFHKTCYTVALKRNSVPQEKAIVMEERRESVKRVNGIEIPYYASALNTTLFDYYQMNQTDRVKIVKKFQLEEDFQKIENLSQRLASADPEILDLVSLVDLKLYPQKAKLALLTNTEFEQMTLDELSAFAKLDNSLDLPSLAGFVNKIAERISISSENAAKVPSQLKHMSLRDLRSFKPIQIYQNQHTIPHHAFSWLSIKQIQALDFSKISSEKIDALFEFREKDEWRNLFLQLHSSQVQSLLNKISLKYLGYIGLEQLRKLDFSGLSDLRISHIFPWTPGGLERRKFAALTPTQIQPILNKLGNHQLKLITEEQIENLDLSVLSESQIQVLFDQTPSQRECALFAALNASQVRSILHRLGVYQLSLITSKQIADLDLFYLPSTKLQVIFQWRFDNREEELFSSLSWQQVQAIMSNLSGYQLELITIEQLQHLDLTVLDVDQLESMFKTKNNQITSEKFAALSSLQIQEILPIISKSKFLLNQITGPQLESLDLTSFPKDGVQLLFSEASALDKNRFSFLPIPQVQDLINKKKLHQDQLCLVSFNQFKELN